MGEEVPASLSALIGFEQPEEPQMQQMQQMPPGYAMGAPMMTAPYAQPMYPYSMPPMMVQQPPMHQPTPYGQSQPTGYTAPYMAQGSGG